MGERDQDVDSSTLAGSATFRWEPAVGAETLIPENQLPTLDPDGELEILELLGEGGVGTVHRANQAMLKRDVAVKRLKRGASSQARARLVHEAQMMGSLEHPNIIPVHALGADRAGHPLLVMKRVRGATWAELLEDPAHPAWQAWTGSPEHLERNVEVLIEVCRALTFAHARSVVHRDVKPDNVMLGSEGEVYLVDWGLATIVGEPTTVAGTPNFMAPEMTEIGAAAPAMDAYCVGATLHSILVGQPRNAGASVVEALASAAACEPQVYGAAVDPTLASLANRLCQRSDRPTVSETAAELRRWVRNRPALRVLDAALVHLERLEHSEAPLEDADVVQFGVALAASAEVLGDEPRLGLAQDRLRRLRIRDAVRHHRALDQAIGWLEELERTGPEPGLREALDEALEHRAELARRAQDMDDGAGNQARTVIVASVSLGAVAVFAGIAAGIVDLHAYASAFGLSVFFSIVLGGNVLALRRALFVNRASTTIVLAMCACAVFLLVNRGSAWWFERSLAEVYTQDLAMLTLASSIVGIAFQRAVLATAGIGGLGYLVATVAPAAWVPEIYAVTATIGPLPLIFPVLRWSLTTRGESSAAEQAPPG